MHAVAHDGHTHMHTPTTDDLAVSWNTNCEVDVGALHPAEALKRGGGWGRGEDYEREEEGRSCMRKERRGGGGRRQRRGEMRTPLGTVHHHATLGVITHTHTQTALCM